MPQREFANEKALVAYAEQNDLAHEYEYSPAFAKRQRLLSAEQYEIVEGLLSYPLIRMTQTCPIGTTWATNGRAEGFFREPQDRSVPPPESRCTPLSKGRDW
jgi:hypothetical protein